MRSEAKESWNGEMFIWRNELQRAAQGNVAGGSDIFRDEMDVPETAGEGREEMDTSQNSEDECQVERREAGEWQW